MELYPPWQHPFFYTLKRKEPKIIKNGKRVAYMPTLFVAIVSFCIAPALFLLSSIVERKIKIGLRLFSFFAERQR